MNTAGPTDCQQDLSASERELLREAALALRGIRYGSVVLTVHDGRIEIDPSRATGGIRENGQPTSSL
jgi:hypothetical protein